MIALTQRRTRGACLLVASILTLVTAQASYAFKIDTHVYIAQQVINDLADDGAVTIVIDGKPQSYAVDPAVVRAVTQQPEYFRMGAIGPDAFPDILGGQMAIHPGDDNYAGWGTSEWLRHLAAAATNDSEVAFARGFFVHAASDVFAHSYMNHYSGNVWLLTDGETDVEERHFILESFIASKNPRILDINGKDLGSAAQTLLNSKGQLAIPAEFLARAYIFDGTAVRNFESGAPHLPFLYHHEDNLAHTEEQARNIAIDIERLVFQYYTGINLNREQMQKLRNLIADIQRAVLPIEDVQKLSGEIAEIRKKFVKIPAEAVDKLLNELVGAYGKFAAERKKLEDAALDVAGFVDKLNLAKDACRAAGDFNEEKCKKLGFLGPFIDPTCIDELRKAQRKVWEKCEDVANVVSLKNQLSAAIAVQNALEGVVLNLKGDVQRIAHEVENIMLAQIDLEHQLLNDALELVKISQGDMNVVVAFIQGWRAGIRKAGAALADANGNALVNSIIPGQDVLDPLTKWLQCYTPVVAGIPHPLADAACSIGDAKTSILGSLKKIAETLAKLDPVAKATLELIDRFEKEVRKFIEEVSVEALTAVTGAPVKQLLEIVRKPGTVQSVTSIFSSGEAHNLRAIPDAAYRVGAEMHLTSDGRFDPEQYAVVYNAIVLSKLSLLGAGQLNKLATDAGLSAPTLYGPQLYDENDAKGGNILLGAVRSIDGSHQWMARAMPFLRTWGHEQPELGRYTYLRDWSPSNGFRLWSDKNARDQMFRHIFKGPLVPGIDAPETIGFPPVLLANYPYWVCAEWPFPEENDPNNPEVVVDKTCSGPRLAAMLAPNPDDTHEDAAAMKAIHTKLADTKVPVSTLTTPNQWFCASVEEEDNAQRNYWTVKFSTNGKFTARVARGKAGEPGARQALSAVNGEFGVTGDFLFTTPKGRAYLTKGGDDQGVPTLVRRFTQHPQRYWIHPTEKTTLELWNQDGTKLFCKTTEW